MNSMAAWLAALYTCMVHGTKASMERVLGLIDRVLWHVSWMHVCDVTNALGYPFCLC
jgi:hypothetical protein